jgi:hypothetical protein
MKRDNEKASQCILCSVVIIIFTLLVAQFIWAPVTVFASSISAGGVSLSPPASSNFVASTLVSPNAQYFGEFGESVAATGNIVVVGSPFESANGQAHAGHVYMFNAETGALISMLTSPNFQTDGKFGFSVAASGNIVAVGAAGETVNGQFGSGHAYTFNAETGGLISTLQSPARLPEEFGFSIAASGNIVAVGTPFESSNGQFRAGQVYIFNVETGGPVSTLTSPNPQFLGGFGSSVAASGNIVAVGATGETVDGQFGAGHVYAFNAETGGIVYTLTSPNAQFAGRFGSSVAARGKMVVVGAPFEKANIEFGENAGHVYTFNAETGALTSTLTSPNAQGDGYFGFSVGASGNVVVVGAPFESANGQGDVGYAYTFNAETGGLISTLTSPKAKVLGEFGSSVAVSVNIVVVGALGETVNGQGFAGNAYTF